MNSTARSSLIGAGVGAGLMFILDPVRGKHRRSVVRDKAVRAAHRTRDAAGATRRDVANRLSGLAADASALWARDDATDRVICDRVRAELGRVSGHPGAIIVGAQNGCVTLTGDVLADDVSQILAAVANVRGVERVQDNMIVYASTLGVPALQGNPDDSGRRRTRLGSRWSPAAMLVAAGAATAAVAVAVAARRAA